MPTNDIPEPIKLATIAREILNEKAGEAKPTPSKDVKHVIIIKEKAAVLVEIDATDVFTDTKKKLAGATKASLRQLKTCLKTEIDRSPQSYDSIKLKEMLKAIIELLEKT